MQRGFETCGTIGKLNIDVNGLMPGEKEGDCHRVMVMCPLKTLRRGGAYYLE